MEEREPDRQVEVEIAMAVAAPIRTRKQNYAKASLQYGACLPERERNTRDGNNAKVLSLLRSAARARAHTHTRVAFADAFVDTAMWDGESHRAWTHMHA